MFAIFLTSIMIYIYVTILLRLFGKKELSQLNVFDFVVFLVLAELVTISIGSDTLNMTHSIIATITLVVIDKVVSIITIHSKKARNILEGQPSYIVVNGQIKQEIMKNLRYSVDDLCHQLRLEGVDSISDVAFAVLERDGTLSIIKKQDSKTKFPDAVIVDGCVNIRVLELLNKDIDWLKKNIHNEEIDNIFYCVVEKDKLVYVKKEKSR